jgi:prepilin-type N-terminal cleavage/methylation domain-containing protein
MTTKPGQDGFSIIELLVVVAITLTVTALAVPTIMATIGNYRVTTSASALAALIQETRMLAVRDNKCYSMETTAVGTNTGFFVDLAQNQTYAAQPFPSTNPQQHEELTQLGATVKLIAAGNMPSQLTATIIGGPSANFTLDSTDAVSFNARGLPCLVTPPGCATATSCQMLPSGNQVGFVYYLSAQPPFGPALYKGVSVTPAGRVRVWTLAGGNWQ